MFPEGTFTRQSGLADFRMGAFVIAAESGVPIVPVSIRGARSILRAGQWLPRSGTVAVVFETPIKPAGSDWTAAAALRDAARSAILRHSGEPDRGRAEAEIDGTKGNGG